MVFIQCIALAGSPEELTGNAVSSSDLWVDMGVAGDAGVVFGGAGGKTHCLWDLGLLGGSTEIAVEVKGHGGGKDSLSSLLNSSKRAKALELLGEDMLRGKSYS